MRLSRDPGPVEAGRETSVIRRFVLDPLHCLCLAAIVLSTIAGFFAVLFGLGAVVSRSVLMGAVLAIIEIAKNTRRMAALMEQDTPPRR